MKQIALAAVGGAVAWSILNDGWSCAVHNLVAHPLMELRVPGGDWIHKHTDPEPFQGLLRRPWVVWPEVELLPG